MKRIYGDRRSGSSLRRTGSNLDGHRDRLAAGVGILDAEKRSRLPTSASIRRDHPVHRNRVRQQALLH